MQLKGEFEREVETLQGRPEKVDKRGADTYAGAQANE